MKNYTRYDWNFVDIIRNMLLQLQSKNHHRVSKFVTHFFYHTFFQREDAKYYNFDTNL